MLHPMNFVLTIQDLRPGKGLKMYCRTFLACSRFDAIEGAVKSLALDGWVEGEHFHIVSCR